MGMRALIREFIREMRASSSGTAPYNTTAKVVRIEGDKAWVSIPGGVPETPVDIAGNVNVGDEVEVGIGGGRAWAYGNYTDHPVGRKIAQAIRKIANDAGERAGAAAEGVSRLEIVTDRQGKAIEAVIVTANGKNRTYHQTTAPTGGEYAVGDVWFDTDDDNKMHRWDGTQWADVTLGDDALDSISADKITAGTIDASQITVSNLDAGNITSGFLDAARIETGSLSIGKTDGLQDALDDARGVAENFLTEITGYNGISVHEAGDLTNFANMNSTGFSVYENLTDVAHLGNELRIGKKSDTSVHFEVVDTGSGDVGLFLAHNDSQIGGIMAGQVPTASTNMTRLIFLSGGSNGHAEFIADDEEASMVYIHHYGLNHYRGRIAIYKGSGNTDKGYMYVDTDNVKVTSSGNMTLSGTIAAGNIDCGDVVIDSPTAGSPTSTTVAFNKTFSTAPVVVITPNSTVPGTGVLGVAVNNITTTGFTAWLTRTNSVNTRLYWIAIGA